MTETLNAQLIETR